MSFSRTHLVLALTVIPIVVAATYSFSWWDLRITKLITINDAMVYGLVRNTKGWRRHDEVRQWPPDLSWERVIDVGFGRIRHMELAPSEHRLVFASDHELCLLDARGGATLWTATCDSQLTEVFFCGDDHVVGGNLFPSDQVMSWHVYRVADGQLIGSLDQPDLTAANVQTRDGRFAYVNQNDELVVIDLDLEACREVSRIPGARGYEFRADGSILVDFGAGSSILDASGALTPVAPGAVSLSQSPSGGASGSAKPIRSKLWHISLNLRRDQLIAMETRGGTMRRRALQAIRRGHMLLIFAAICVAFAVWTVALLRDGVRSPRAWRVASDVVIVFVVLPGLWSGAYHFLNYLWTLCCAVAACAAFFGVLGLRNSDRHWWILLLAILVLPLTPFVVVALMLRQFRWRLRRRRIEPAQESAATSALSPQSRQIVLRDVFLATAAIAAVLGFARIFVGSNVVAEALTLTSVACVVLALLIRFSRVGAGTTWVLVGGTAFLLAFSIADELVDFPTDTVILLVPAVPLFLSMHLKAHGYVMRRIALGSERVPG